MPCWTFSVMSIISRLNNHHFLGLILVLLVVMMLRTSSTRLLRRSKTSLFGTGCWDHHSYEVRIVIQTSTCRHFGILVLLWALSGRTSGCWVVRKAGKGSFGGSVKACVRLDLTKILTWSVYRLLKMLILLVVRGVVTVITRVGRGLIFAIAQRILEWSLNVDVGRLYRWFLHQIPVWSYQTLGWCIIWKRI